MMPEEMKNNPEVSGPEINNNPEIDVNSNNIENGETASDNNNSQAVQYDPNARAKMQEQINADTDRKMGETVARAADLYFTGGSVGKAVDAAENIPIAGGMVKDAKNQLFDAVGKPIGQAMDTVDGVAGTDLRGTANNANQAGAFDMANSAMSMAGGAQGGGTTAAPTGGMPGGTAVTSGVDGVASAPNGMGSPETIASSNPSGDMQVELPETESANDIPAEETNNSSDNSSDSSDSIFQQPFSMMNKPLIVWGSVFLILVLIAVIASPNVGATLDVTDRGNGEVLSPGTQVALTESQIEDGLVYVGDSRTVGLSYALNKPNIKYVAESAKGYDWFISDGQTQLNEYLALSETKFVVFNLGINDLGNIDRYINLYNGIISSNTNVKIYFMSVNPVDEALAVANGYTVKNTDIQAFNTKLASAVGDAYIDSYKLVINYFSSSDGVHYDNPTYVKIHNIVLDFIRSNNIITNEYGESATPDYSEDTGTTSNFETSTTYPNMSPERGKFGQFPYNDAPEGRNITTDPRWVSANIITINFPCDELNINVKIHKLSKPNFDAAFTNICRLVTVGISGIKLSTSEVNFNGAYVSRKTSAGGYSLHGYGLAIDLNVTWTATINGTKYTPYKSMGNSTYNEYQRFINALGKEDDPRNINYVLWKYAFEPAGFKWGGNWSAASFDPMHYEVDWRA